MKKSRMWFFVDGPLTAGRPARSARAQSNVVFAVAFKTNNRLTDAKGRFPFGEPVAKNHSNHFHRGITP